MGNLAYDVGVNILGGVLSAVLVLWVVGRWNARNDLRWQIVRLRNVLYDAEHALDALNHDTTIFSTGERVVTPTVTMAEWSRWHDQCVQIRYALFEIAERKTLEAGIKESRFLIPRESALPHFRGIGSVFVETQPTRYLGIIECTTETLNLLAEARKKTECLTHYAAKYRESIDKKTGVSEMATNHFEEEIEIIRQKIIAHRLYVEKLIPGPSA